LDAREELVVAAPPVAVTAKPEIAKEAPPAEKPSEKTGLAKQEPKPDTPSKTDKPASVAKSKDDGNKAQALLEGKTAKPTAERVVIQVGAFSDAAKVRDVRSKLEQAGVKTYTQTVERDGKTTTRIRVGPFDSKEEADKAAVRIRKLDLPVSFLRL
jgi:DedD protein